MIRVTATYLPIGHKCPKTFLERSEVRQNNVLKTPNVPKTFLEH